PKLSADPPGSVRLPCDPGSTAAVPGRRYASFRRLPCRSKRGEPLGRYGPRSLNPDGMPEAESQVDRGPPPGNPIGGRRQKCARAQGWELPTPRPPRPLRHSSVWLTYCPTRIKDAGWFVLDSSEGVG